MGAFDTRTVFGPLCKICTMVLHLLCAIHNIFVILCGFRPPQVPGPDLSATSAPPVAIYAPGLDKGLPQSTHNLL